MRTEPAISQQPPRPDVGSEVATLDPSVGYLVVINTYAVAPDQVEALLDLLVRATEEVLRHVPGFISASFHTNTDGTQLVNYARWRDAGALAAARDCPGVIERIAEAGKLADSFNPVQYQLRRTIPATGASGTQDQTSSGR